MCLSKFVRVHVCGCVCRHASAWSVSPCVVACASARGALISPLSMRNSPARLEKQFSEATYFLKTHDRPWLA